MDNKAQKKMKKLRNIIIVAIVSLAILFIATRFESSKVTDYESAEVSLPTPTKTEELPPIELVSKTILEEGTYKTLYDFKEEIPEKEFMLLDEYTSLIRFLSTPHTKNEKHLKIEEVMNEFENKLDIFTVDDYEKKYEYFGRLVTEKFVRLSKIYNTGQIDIGMSVLDVIVSLGYPNKINNTVTESGKSSQWVYENIYVYLKDNIVTSYQN